jgi:hypothetical protein
MMPNAPKEQPAKTVGTTLEPMNQAGASGAEEVQLRRWQVSFASGRVWYPVGEFVALDAKSAIDRAIDIFGSAADYLAEEIPWDAAPFHQAKKSPRLQGGVNPDSSV